MNKRLRILRKALNLTLEKFGEKLGVKKNTVSQWENGKNITDQTIASICNVNWNGKYVNAEWFRTGNGEMFKENSDDELKLLAEKYKMSDMEYTFLKEYFKLPKNCRETFFETLDTMFSAIYKNASPTSSDISATSEQPTKSLEELSDDEKVELYRQELKREREVTEKLRALQKSG